MTRSERIDAAVREALDVVLSVWSIKKGAAAHAAECWTCQQAIFAYVGINWRKTLRKTGVYV